MNNKKKLKQNFFLLHARAAFILPTRETKIQKFPVSLLVISKSWVMSHIQDKWWNFILFQSNIKKKEIEGYKQSASTAYNRISSNTDT